MTRDELRVHCESQIEKCEMWAKWKKEKPHGHIYEEHKLMLELLKQESCEVAIDKTKVFDILRRNYREHYRDVDGDWVPGSYREDIYDEIKALPPVTPVRKKGKWIKIGDRGFGYSDTVICKCSECEYKAEFTGKFDGLCLVVDMERAYKFCPNCSAEMENE